MFDFANALPGQISGVPSAVTPSVSHFALGMLQYTTFSGVYSNPYRTFTSTSTSFAHSSSHISARVDELASRFCSVINICFISKYVFITIPLYS